MSQVTQITSTCEAGTIITLNAWIDPSNCEKYLKLFEPLAAELRKHPENLFTAICVNPTDPGHIRIVHGWTKASAWFFEVSCAGR
jgi:quinol monooxygenase YgiN